MLEMLVNSCSTNDLNKLLELVKNRLENPKTAFNCAVTVREGAKPYLSVIPCWNTNQAEKPFNCIRKSSTSETYGMVIHANNIETAHQQFTDFCREYFGN